MLKCAPTPKGGRVNGCSVADYDSGEFAGIVSPMMYAWADNEDKDWAFPGRAPQLNLDRDNR